MRIKNLAVSPSWFDLANYREVEAFTAIDWLYHLAVRRQLLDTVIAAEGTSNAAPHPPIAGYPPLRSLFPCGAERVRTPTRPVIADLDIPSFSDASPSSAVNDMPVWAAFAMTELLRMADGPECVGNRWWRAMLGGTGIDDAAAASVNHRLQALSEIPEPDPIVYAAINLHAPEDVAVAAFVQWFRRARTGRALTSTPRRSLGEKYFGKWAAYRILPYLDLTLWLHATQQRRSDRWLADVLFAGFDGVPSDRLRKHTKKYAAHALHPRLLSALQLESQLVLELCL